MKYILYNNVKLKKSCEGRVQKQSYFATLRCMHENTPPQTFFSCIREIFDGQVTIWRAWFWSGSVLFLYADTVNRYKISYWSHLDILLFLHNILLICQDPAGYFIATGMQWPVESESTLLAEYKVNQSAHGPLN